MSETETGRGRVDPLSSTRDDAANGEREQLIELYGITQVRADYYQWGGYRYSRLEDALNYARRQQRPS